MLTRALSIGATWTDHGIEVNDDGLAVQNKVIMTDDVQCVVSVVPVGRRHADVISLRKKKQILRFHILHWCMDPSVLLLYFAYNSKYTN